MKKLNFVFVVLFAVLVFACQSLSVEGDFGPEQFDLTDQNNTPRKFPQMIKGKIGVVGYIFTNCPDICPLTTNNMRLIQEELKKEKINDEVEFVSISFDPEVDRPKVLKKFAEIRDLDLNNWTFLTGEKTITDSLIKQVGVIAVVGDSSVTKEGDKIYYYVHTDRISLVDEEGNIRKNYLGSRVKIDEVVADIKKLL
jgi:protein SCO1/2